MREMQHRRAERGQAYALEGIIGAVIVVSALVLGLQAVDIAPWTGGSESEIDETRIEVADVLDSAQDSDALRAVATCLTSDGEPRPDVASTENPATGFGEILANTIADDYQYRVAIDYPTGESEVETVYVGAKPSLPNQQTATVSRYLAIADSDPVFDGESCEPTGETLSDRDSDDLYLENRDEESNVYTVLRVRVVAW